MRCSDGEPAIPLSKPRGRPRGAPCPGSHCTSRPAPDAKSPDHPDHQSSCGLRPSQGTSPGTPADAFSHQGGREKERGAGGAESRYCPASLSAHPTHEQQSTAANDSSAHSCHRGAHGDAPAGVCRVASSASGQNGQKCAAELSARWSCLPAPNCVFQRRAFQKTASLVGARAACATTANGYGVMPIQAECTAQIRGCIRAQMRQNSYTF